MDYRCGYGPGDRPFVESHQRYSLAYVRKGSFGCQAQGVSHELVAGSLMVGYPGDEYMCTHKHHAGGDECLAFHFSPALADAFRGKNAVSLDGEEAHELMVVLRFADLAAAKRWRTSPEYRRIVPIRDEAAEVVLTAYDA